MDKKFQFNWYQANDAAAMERKLEKMAEKGWLLDEMTNWGFRYRRGEPGEVHYAVTYFPQASVYDAGPTEEQQTYADYCAAAGWEFVSNWGPLQIFRSTRANPVPIETDEAEKLQAIHKSMLKTLVLSYGMLLAVWIMNLALRFSSIKRNPLGFFSSNQELLFMGFLLFFVLQLAFILVDYFVWYLRSKKSVERGEGCLQPHTRLRFWLSMVLLATGVPALVTLFAGLSQVGNIWMTVYCVISMPLIMVLSQGLLKWLKRRGFDRSVTRGVHIGGAVVLGIAYAVGITILVTRSAERVVDPRAEVYVDSRGFEWEIHSDALPVTLEDLGYTVTEEDHCSYQSDRSKTILMDRAIYVQESYGEGSTLPYLRYEVTDVKAGFLLEPVLELTTGGYYLSVHGMSFLMNSYTLADEPLYGADRMYVAGEGSLNNGLYLVYGQKILHIDSVKYFNDERIVAIVEQLGLI